MRRHAGPHCLVMLALCLGMAPAWARAGGADISAFAEQWLIAQYSQPGSTVKARASAVDDSLALADCSGAMSASLPPNIRPRPRMSVQVRCTGTAGWSVRVPVSLEIFRQVLVTTRPLLRGDGLQAGDLRSESHDITRLGYGYVETLQQVAGRTLARPLAAGSVLTPAALGGREMVRAGDHVQVVAALDGIEVRAEGVALGSGDNGARLRVRNEVSGRVVDAMVDAPGVVRALP
ncbi:flagellar basal body P-ring formation chaperone FlgA [Dyella sp.]|jgi:flagella basal body P-ring formation protein FlgA|uniref:flagellar basal body P-ring formation chaperone FlgA n=1 Tax=Dyella sp. TaxID=1869338 RepID=UPI002D77C3CA|nr:flagellar basal body P-ring formation chaperone FlgA [Dyella sp.]HET6433636.1 flagellar basal body P-ring formation chaperone FlgA [Dyella sp.]